MAVVTVSPKFQVVIPREIRVALGLEPGQKVHALLILVPQQGPFHLTSDRFARVEEKRVVFDFSMIPTADRAVLDRQAAALAIAMSSK